MQFRDTPICVVVELQGTNEFLLPIMGEKRISQVSITVIFFNQNIYT